MDKVPLVSFVIGIAATIVFGATNYMLETEGSSYWLSYSSTLLEGAMTISGFVFGFSLLALLLGGLVEALGGFYAITVFLGKAALGLTALGAMVFVVGLTIDHYSTEWSCVEKGQTMHSISDKGEIGPAEEACTCTGMADFERRKFGRVDYAGLNKDHGCDFD